MAKFEMYRDYAMMYNPLNNCYYFYTGDYVKSRARNYKTIDSIKRAIDRLYV